tara:strand:- start:1889 stop:3901 length:2013 start_codon:yes stop_codon:yes gene_type:complete
MAFASPGVSIKEVDLTATINVADQNIGVIAIAAQKGPTDEVTYISSERELVDIFGGPDDYNYESWFAAATVIQYGGIAAIIRPAGGEPASGSDLSLRTANVDTDGTTDTGILINNQSDYEENYATTTAWVFAAKYAGTFHNGIKVVMVDVGAHQQIKVNVTGSAPSVGDYVKVDNVAAGNVYSITGSGAATIIQITLDDTTKRFAGSGSLKSSGGTVIGTITELQSNDVYSTVEYDTGKKWVSIAPQPGTSPFAKARGGKFDEFHIALIDSLGNVTGNPGTLIETFTFVSKAKDAKSSEGVVSYWRKVLELKSNYIYGGEDSLAQAADITAVDTSAGSASGASIGDTASSNLFPLFNKVISQTLTSGADYDWAGSSATINSAVESSYDLVSDPEEFGDIDFLVPGMITGTVAAKLIAISESRRDCITVLSPRRSDVINSSTSTKKTDNIVDFFNTVSSSSYAIFDSGYKYLYDKYNDTYRYVPCAADVAGLCISSTINSETWFSPAGYNRGNLRNAAKLAYSPRKAERDRLYTARVNPVVAFPGQGVVLFGDKTGLSSPSAFDRINVRRLFIELEKNIARFSKFQLFEINDELTRSAFKGAVDPYLRNVQGRRGIYDFLVVCDDSNNTADVIDRNEFQAEIYIKPARSINFITITFVATRTGVSFNELIG